MAQRDDGYRRTAGAGARAEEMLPQPSRRPESSDTVGTRRRARAGGVVMASPYAWPYDGQLTPSRTALLVLDMQTDFCGKSGYVDRMGYDVFSTARAIEPTRRLLEVVRSIPELTVIYTREGHRPDLADLAPNKRWRSRQIGAEIGAQGPAGRILVRGESGWQIVSQLTPLPGELIVDKPGKGSFYASDLDLILRSRGITHLILTGMTTDVGVQSTMREANDRGYECLILEDCTGATDIDNHIAALRMVTMQGGVFGAVTSSDQLIRALLRLSLESARQAAGEPQLNGPVSTRYERGEWRMPRNIHIDDARPYAFASRLSQTALVVIDMQNDFCSPGGFGELLGNDIAPARAIIPIIGEALAAARAAGLMVIHTREGHRPDLSDCPPSKLARSRAQGAGIGDVGPMGRILVRGEPGHAIVPELAPLPGEPVIDKPGKGAFYETSLQELLEARGVTSLIVCGVTTHVCVHTTIREANDRGYECLLLEDASAAFDPADHEAAVRMIWQQGGIFGWTAPAAAFRSALQDR
ncbi:hypothetical protein PA598K_05131 [Paenibacillus sp. 598K]|uniref:cysteine hydrolase family protein n=1 Tax=Paenibacillus sp. 598K TaxID=1117987 RepID=UPI000FF9C0C5|nr:isochorismatase family protein [Paenibacillus sp. 598K]GBF76650.1 hypothetical protein PA598K_05131 [Paenibacillus sp. 598K]